MNYLDFHAGQRCQFIHKRSDDPQWLNCIIKGVSEYGIALGIDVVEEGQKTIWLERDLIDADIEFRQIIDFSLYWQHHSGQRYEMICVANERTSKEGFDRTVVYRDPYTGAVYSRPADVFLNKFTPVLDLPTIQPESDSILDSQDAPIVVEEGVQ